MGGETTEFAKDDSTEDDNDEDEGDFDDDEEAESEDEDDGFPDGDTTPFDPFSIAESRDPPRGGYFGVKLIF